MITTTFVAGGKTLMLQSKQVKKVPSSHLPPSRMNIIATNTSIIAIVKKYQSHQGAVRHNDSDPNPS